MSRTRTTVSDFSSAEYWASRFNTETSFEWLLPSSKIIAFILESFPLNNKPRIRCLHLGCGTSTLGMELEDALKTARPEQDVEVIDSDYVAESIKMPTGHSRPILTLNALDPQDLAGKSEGGWDLIIDKSTADAISCGPFIDDLEPLDVLCNNLAEVTEKGTRWISISYSPTRFSSLEPASEVKLSQGARAASKGEGAIQGKGRNEGNGGEEGKDGGGGGWKVVEKRFLASTSLPEGRRWRDKSGVERVVFEPETGVWGWVLERV